MAVQDLNYRVSVNDAALDRLISKVETLNATLYSSSAAVRPLDAQLRAMGRRTVEVGRNITRNITVPLALIGVAATRTATEFGRSMAKIGSLTGATNAELAKMEQTILDLGNEKLLQGPRELAEGLYFIRSSGFEGAKAMDVLEASSQAAFAGLGDLGTVADATTSAMNAYGAEIKRASDVTDVLIATVREGKAEPAELATAIGRVIPLAHQMGVAFDEVGGAIAALTLQGLSADLAVTGLRALLTTFTRALVPTKKALQGLGFTIEDINSAIAEKGLFPSMMALREEVDKFDSSLGGLDDELVKAAKLGGLDAAVQKLQTYLGNTSDTLLSKLFPNVRALTTFLILTSNKGTQAAGVIKAVGDSAGDTATAVRRMAATDVGKFQLALNRLEKAWTRFAKASLPAVTPLIDAAAKLLDGFNKLPPSVKQLIAINGVLLAVVGPLLIVFGRLLQISSVYALKLMGVRKETELVTKSVERNAAVSTEASKRVVLGIEAETAAIVKELAVLERKNQYAQRYYSIQQQLPGTAYGNVRPGPVLFGAGRPPGQFQSTVGYRAGAQGPGGAPVLFSGLTQRRMNEIVSNERKMISGTRGLAGVFKGATVAAGALAGALSALAPLLAFEGLILYAQHWREVNKALQGLDATLENIGKHWTVIGQISPKAGSALGKIASYALLPGLLPVRATGAILERLLGKDPDESIKKVDLARKKVVSLAIEYQKMVRLGMSRENARRELLVGLGDPKIAAEKYKGSIDAAVKLAATTTSAELERVLAYLKDKNGRTAAKYAADVAHSAAKAFAAQIEKDKALLEIVKDRFSEAFDRLMSDAEAAFDARTDAMLDKLRYTVRVGSRAFTLVGDELTPAEKQLARMDKAKALRDIRTRVRDAIKAVGEARKEAAKAGKTRRGEYRAGGWIFGFVEQGDKEEQKQAAQKVKDANATLGEALYDQRRFNVEQIAQVERTAADKAHTEAAKQFTSMRDLEKRHWQDRAQIIHDGILAGTIEWNKGMKQLDAIFAANGISLKQSGRDLGSAFAIGLGESMAAVRTAMKEIGTITARIAKASADAKKAAKAARDAAKEGGKIKQPAQPLPFAIVPFPGGVPGAPESDPFKYTTTGANVYIFQTITNDADATAAANKVARAVNHR